MLEDVELVRVPEAAIDRARVTRGGLYQFVKLAWSQIEPSRFVGGWHIQQICRHLEAISRRDIKRLVINVPPGSSKSTVTSILWPAWHWIYEPAHKWMFATFDAMLARRHALACRRLIHSQWYQERWPHVQISDSEDVQTTQQVYCTTGGGMRISTTPGGSLSTGWHADTQVVDDPTKPADIAGDPEMSREALRRTAEWWKTTMATRRVDAAKFARVCIMQRLHEADLAGELVSEGYTHLMLPMRFEPERACRTVTDDGRALGGDRRTVAGELLAPKRFADDVVRQLEHVELGAQQAAAQLQQRPAPASGNIFERAWFKRWHELPSRLRYALSVDCSFKDTATADYVAMQLWGFNAAEFYLIDRLYLRLGLPETCDKILWMLDKHRAAGRLITATVIEDKANGPAVEQTFRRGHPQMRGGKSTTRFLPGLIMVNPEGGKVARANASAPPFRAGNVYIPATSPDCLWPEEYVENMVAFPFAKNDDDVDATTQAVIYFLGDSADSYVAGVRALTQEAMGR